MTIIAWQMRLEVPINADKMPESGLSTQQKSVYQFVAENGQITSHQAESLPGVKRRRARAILGEISIGGTLIKVEDLASTLQVCLDSSAKKVLLPITSAADLGIVPSDLVGAHFLYYIRSTPA